MISATGEGRPWGLHGFSFFIVSSRLSEASQFVVHAPSHYIPGDITAGTVEAADSL